MRRLPRGLGDPPTPSSRKASVELGPHVSLGGTRDTTDVIQCTELAALREHLSASGGFLRSIAVAKPGIIKEGETF
ncbi:hypothetical protein U9M48_037583, partial [Paspalum notatum var. saurae]